MSFFSHFSSYFLYLLVSLLVIKAFLVIYRVATRKWPPSVRFLFEIVEWDVEARKVAALALLSFLLTLVRYF